MGRRRFIQKPAPAKSAIRLNATNPCNSADSKAPVIGGCSGGGTLGYPGGDSGGAGPGPGGSGGG